MSYYEYFELFSTVLNLISNILRYQRLAGENEHPSETFTSRIRNEITKSAFLNNILPDEIKQILTDLFILNLSNTSQIVINSVNDIFKTYTYNVPKIEENPKIISQYFCPTLFSVIKLDLFYEIYCNLLLECTVIFICPNLSLLSSSMYF